MTRLDNDGDTAQDLAAAEMMATLNDDDERT